MLSYFDIYTEDGNLFHEMKDLIAPYILNKQCRCFMSMPSEYDTGYSFILKTECFDLQLGFVDRFYKEFSNGTIEATDGTNFKKIDEELMRKANYRNNTNKQGEVE